MRFLSFNQTETINLTIAASYLFGFIYQKRRVKTQDLIVKHAPLAP